MGDIAYRQRYVFGHSMEEVQISSAIGILFEADEAQRAQAVSPGGKRQPATGLRPAGTKAIENTRE